MNPTKPHLRRDQHVVISPDIVRQRRKALRIPIATLASALGVSSGVIDHLEAGGEQNHITLGLVHDLARVLGLHVRELLIEPSTPATTPHDTVDPDDPTTVGRILADVGPVHADELAEALSWTRSRTMYALALLEERLPTVGQRLAWLADSQVRIIHAPGPPTALAALTKTSATTWGLGHAATAHLSWVAAHETSGGYRAAGKQNDPVVIARLKAAGLITDIGASQTNQRRAKPEQERLRLTDQARFNLCLPGTEDTRP